MKATGASVGGPSSASRRSQPPRQTRTNPARRTTLSTASKNAPRNGVNAAPPQASINQRFYPALASFTDSIDALPAEIIRNFTLLREVDAKACHPEEQLRRYIAAVKSLPAPLDPNEADPALDFLRRQEKLKRRREEALMKGENPPPETDVEISGETVEQYPETRRSRLQQIRMVLQDLLPMLDEKIHVITVTAETLNKHNLRVEQAYSFVKSEVPEVYRTGDPEHWGYKPNPPRGANARAAAQEQRQAALQAAANHAAAEESRLEYSASNSRAELRREANARKQAAQAAAGHGHDEEDGLHAHSAPSKRPHGGSRARKDPDATSQQRAAELTPGGIGAASTGQAPKRRKPNTGGSADKGGQEKSNHVRGTTSPRAGTPATAKRATKGAAAASTANPNAGTGGRRR